MKMKSTVKIEYSCGRYRKLTLVEENPQIAVGEVDGEITEKRAATAEEVEAALRKSFAVMMRELKVRSFIDSETKKVVIIRFERVDDIEISVEEVAE